MIYIYVSYIALTILQYIICIIIYFTTEVHVKFTVTLFTDNHYGNLINEMHLYKKKSATKFNVTGFKFLFWTFLMETKTAFI